MTALRAKTPTVVFMFLLTPYGVSSGYVGVTLAYLLAQAHMPTAAVAAIVSFTIWPQTWKVLWAPMVDTTLNAKTWYRIGALLTGLSILALSAAPATIKNTPTLILLVVVSSVASTLISMSSEVIMAHGIKDERKGAVSGWSQAGNLGGAGIGGGLGLTVAQNIPAPWVSGAVLAVMCVACAAALWFVDEPVREARGRHYFEGVKDLGRDVWAVSRSRLGFLVLLLMLLPIGSGGAQGVWAAIASEWHAGAETVALINGVMSGVASLIGAVLAGYVCDWIDRRWAYCLFGLALAAVAIVMALLPRTPMVFIASTLTYALVLGACYAAYSAAVLEAIGKGAAATKFNLLSAVSNIPIAFMTAKDGQLHDWYGSNGMLFGEAGAAIVAVIGFGLFVRLTRGVRIGGGAVRSAAG
jgi:MFS family permease